MWRINFKAGVLLLITAVIVTSFIGCKKGDDDPWLSFRGRKNRITNNWKLQKGRVLITTYPPLGGSTQRTITYGEGGGYSVTETGGFTEQGSYEIKLRFYKDGRFTKEHNETPNGSTRGTSKEEGTWHFSGGNSNFEKRELLALLKEESSFLSQNTSLNTSINYNGGNLFQIQRLAFRELVLKAKQRITSGGTIQEIDEEWTFIPQ
ncbi:MAG: hypothetical protein EBS07_10030 [Sphingobacteriia bacterium]|nr:hypothetical protein [Sphingobacteriia bacterium]